MPSALRIAPDGMTFDLPNGGPLLAGPVAFGGGATVGGSDGRPRVAIVSDPGEAARSADLYVVRPGALGSDGGARIRRLRRRARGALVAGPASPDGAFERWHADVLLMQASGDAMQTAWDALAAGVRAEGRPVLVDVAEPVPAESVLAAFDAGAAGVVVATGDDAADTALLEEVALLEARRLDGSPLVSVAICVRNSPVDLDRCLASLEAVTYPRFETLVCDDGSTDGTVAVAHRHGARVLPLDHVGLALARNWAVHEALGEYVVFIDADEEAEPDWLSRLWRLHDRLGAEMVGGPNRPFPDAGWEERAVGGAPGVAMPIVRSDGTCTHLPGCNFSILSELAREVGYTSDVPGVGEDLYFCFRVLDAGARMLFHPTASVLHHRRRSLRGYLGQMHSYGQHARTINQALDYELVELEERPTLLERLDPRRPHPCFVGPQADQRYSLAHSPLTSGFPVKLLATTLAAGAVALPAAALAGRGRQAGAAVAAAVLAQLAYVVARAPAQPGAHGAAAVANRLLTAALWYAGPAATLVGDRIRPASDLPLVASPATVEA